MRRVHDFIAFTPDNDPHGEHDFGSFEFAGKTIFWKIDCYDRDLNYGSPDPRTRTYRACPHGHAGGGVLILRPAPPPAVHLISVARLSARMSKRVRAFRRFEPCLLRASGAIICPTITRSPEKSAIARAAIAATTRTQSPSSLLIGLSEDCGAERTDHRRRAVSGSSCFRSLLRPSVPSPRSVWAARDGTLVRKRSDGGAGRPRPRAHAHPPALNAHCGSLVVRIGLGLRLYGNSRPVAAMPSPLMNIWDATFKEKAAGGCVDCRPLACRPRGNDR